MITHIVLIKLKEQNPDVQQRIVDSLRRLPALIPEIEHYEVGINVVPSERAYDIAIYSRFADLQALETYSKHPEHVAVLPYIRENAASVVAVDYES